MPEMDDDRVADLVDEQLRYLRGEGPEPDLTGLTDDERAHVLELFDVVDALADSLPASPPIEEDPVAVRLGLAPVFAHGISLDEPAGSADVDVEEVQ